MIGSIGTSKMLGLLGLAYLLPSAVAHIALWDPAMYGYDPSDPNQQEPVNPLADMTFDQWWFHGYINKPPAAGAIMNLPSGGTYHGQVACNKALTTFGGTPSQHNGLYACDGDGPQGGIGPLHTADQWQAPNPKDVKGCGIAIAYKDDVNSIQPEDFTVITVNYTCPWFKHVDFQIPSDLPPCPPGGCHCMWGWVHSADSGSEQMYFNGYRCNITGATGTMPLPTARIANKCPVDKTNCTVGAKQPHYWLQKERNNNFQDYYDPPFYNGDYGFSNGAQTDLFANAAALSTTTTPKSTTTLKSTTTPAIPIATMTVNPVIQGALTTTTTIATVTASPTLANNNAAATGGSTGTQSGAGSSCKRRKRALDLLNDPKALARHEQRVKKRSNRLMRKRSERRSEVVQIPSSESRINRTTERSSPDQEVRSELRIRRVAPPVKRAAGCTGK